MQRIKKKKKNNEQKSIYPNTVGSSAGKSLRHTKTSKLYILAMVSPESSSFKKVASVREQKISSKTLRDRKIIQLILHSVCQYDNFSQYYSISEPVVVNAFFHKQHSHSFSVNLKSQFFTHISRYIYYYFYQRLQMADEETSDSDAAITVPATPVTKKKRLAPSKVKTTKPKKTHTE